jgi:hypothetical protein
MSFKPSCGTCLYLSKPGLVYDWATERDELRGYCMRYPPVADKGTATRRPLMLLTEGCGEWQAKEAE